MSATIHEKASPECQTAQQHGLRGLEHSSPNEHPLPLALRGGVDQLSAEARAAIKRLERRDPVRFCLTLSSAWLHIIAAIALASYLQNPIVSFFVICFVATRQNVLGLLMHEQCHRLGFYSKAGDLLCNLTVCYPLLITLDGYRRVHLAHHQNYFTDRDPDYIRKQGPAWTFPQRLRHLLGLFLRDLTGLSILNTIRGKGGEPSAAGRTTRRWQLAARIAFYMVVAALITWAHLWPTVLLYWFLPLVTILQVIVRWGAICEHKYDLVDPDVIESTPIIEPRWWENLLLPNLNFTLHIYHHWFPRVPFSKLPHVHRIFRCEGLVDDTSVFSGYGSYLAHLLGFPRV